MSRRQTSVGVGRDQPRVRVVAVDPQQAGQTKAAETTDSHPWCSWWPAASGRRGAGSRWDDARRPARIGPFVRDAVDQRAHALQGGQRRGVGAEHLTRPAKRARVFSQCFEGRCINSEPARVGVEGVAHDGLPSSGYEQGHPLLHGDRLVLGRRVGGEPSRAAVATHRHPLEVGAASSRAAHRRERRRCPSVSRRTISRRRSR